MSDSVLVTRTGPVAEIKLHRPTVHNAFDERANDFRWTQCAVNGFDHNPACGLNPYYMINAPRTVGLRFGQRF